MVEQSDNIQPSEFEGELVGLLRKKRVSGMKYPGSITIHYNSELKPVSVEIKEIRK